MSKQDKKAFEPKLRFKRDDGADFSSWSVRPLKEIAVRSTKKNSAEDVRRVLTNSASDGVVDQRDYFEKDIANKDNLSGYFVVEKDAYVYNPRVSSLAPVGPISKNKAGKGVMSPLYTVFSFNDSDNDFYEHYFKSNQWHAYMRKVSNTGARHDRMNVTNDDFMSMPMPCPEKGERDKIADCLSSLDELITVEEQKLNDLKAHKNGLMQQLFPTDGKELPKLRFPEFKGTQNWVKKSFSEMFEIGSGKDYKHLGKGDIPVYGSGGYMLSVDDYLYEGESACIGRKGTIDKPVFLSGKFWTVDTLFYTHSFKNCLPKFVFLLFQNINWRNHSEAGGVPSLSKQIINRIEVYIPKSTDEQQKIIDCISYLDNAIDEQKYKVDCFRKHKKGLMQQLFPLMEKMGI
ncbi:restriction endonuclease subunit S [Vibrio fluvialis]|nr:restriction endonuclease subunit S [Vibrio fluvialis]